MPLRFAIECAGIAVGFVAIQPGMASDLVWDNKQAGWVPLAPNGVPSPDQVLLMNRSRLASRFTGVWWIDVPDQLMVFGAIGVGFNMDGAGNLGDVLDCVALDPKLAKVTLTLARSL